MAFQVGQRVRCINKLGWCEDWDANKPFCGPAYGEVCTVIAVVDGRSGECLMLSQWPPDKFLARCFRPLTDSPKAVKRTMERHFNKFLKEPANV